MDSLVLQTLIGLVFIFGTFAALVSIITEIIAHSIGLRGEYMLRGMRTLVDGGGTFELPWADMFGRRRKTAPRPDPDSKVSDVMCTPIIRRMAKQGAMPERAGNKALTNVERRAVPSYVSGRSFARAFLGYLVPDVQGRDYMTEVKAQLLTLPDGPRNALLPLVDQAQGDVGELLRSIEQWYEDQMDRVTEWYKRHVQWISLAIGAVLVVGFNLSAVGIAHALYTDEALRTSVVAQATEAAQCTDKAPAECLADVRDEIDGLRGSGLPIGWSTPAECQDPAAECSTWEKLGLTNPDSDRILSDLGFFLMVVLGWAVMVIALLPGARSWFDALSKLGSLRYTGPKPKREKA